MGIFLCLSLACLIMGLPGFVIENRRKLFFYFLQKG